MVELGVKGHPAIARVGEKIGSIGRRAKRHL